MGDLFKLVGISRQAADGMLLGENRRVEYRSLPSRKWLNRCDSERVPFHWSINPYRGCEYGCKYCYAPYTHEFMELHAPEDFERRIFVKQGAADRLVEELRRNRRAGEWIAIGSATDPYQPAERRFG